MPRSYFGVFLFVPHTILLCQKRLSQRSGLQLCKEGKGLSICWCVFLLDQTVRLTMLPPCELSPQIMGSW